MLNVITNPSGIDVPIRKFQERLHKQLMTAWGLDTTDQVQNAKYQCFARCYRNKKDNGYIAEVFETGKDYRDLYWDDTLAALSFFGITSSEHDIEEKAKVHLIFFVDLKKLKPTLTHRADEEVRLDVLKLIQTANNGFTFDSVDLWLENVLKEYNGSYRDERLKKVDMQPVHCFRINFTLNYNIKNCYN